MIEYNDSMRITKYKSGEIEIIEGENYLFYFESIGELAKLIKTSPQVKKELMEAL